ncbi:AAA family ATPase [Deinococcus sp. QL22]|uniref:AAA family ATPase n=1 Tax=Deinococcus sp. QL22 TaxID=2939437 RepID=UPI00201705D4|nr:AAA family ATPase [Deinococcus sp. QL22]UQN08710.1 AAA family ATPase [Deinococcus sp. QL22]
MKAFLNSLRESGTPDFRAFQQNLGHVFPLLDSLPATEQDPEWHAEGDVGAHTGLVLNEAYRLADQEGLADDLRQILILAAALHDLGKALTTRRARDDNEHQRVISPRHADRGRSYLAYRLPELGLPAAVLHGVLALVGHHHDLARTLQTGTLAAYRRLARQVNLPLLYLLEVADVRGRVTADQAARLDDLEYFRLQAQEYGVWNTDSYGEWQAEISSTLAGFPPDFLDLTVQGGILDHEAGLIQVPQEAVSRSYAARAGFPHLVVTCGPSGSGKSSWIAERLPDHQVVSLDAIRDELAGKRADQSLNGQVLQAAKERLRVALRRNGKVVWDATNTRRDFRRVPLGLGLDYGALTTLVVFQPPVSTVFGRNPARQHTVPASVLAQQIENAEFPYLPEAHRTLWLDEFHRETGRAGWTE